MKQSARNKLVWGFAAVCLLLAAVCLKLDDLLIVGLLDDVNSIKLARQARSDLSMVHAEEREMTARVEALRSRVAALAARRVPSLDDLKALQAEHHLRLIQLERIANRAGEGTDVIGYRTVLAGTVGSAVRFLHDLEDRFLVKSDQITLSALGEDGSQVNLVLTVEVTRE